MIIKQINILFRGFIDCLLFRHIPLLVVHHLLLKLLILLINTAEAVLPVLEFINFRVALLLVLTLAYDGTFGRGYSPVVEGVNSSVGATLYSSCCCGDSTFLFDLCVFGNVF